mmetsp:Transcript_21464/g.57206  ORF Transcript_21464/g.57206 Transcript_21464/m.57206 type:complete len:231 (-) Transcript_21464:1198-1890(-)
MRSRFLNLGIMSLINCNLMGPAGRFIAASKMICEDLGTGSSIQNMILQCGFLRAVETMFCACFVRMGVPIQIVWINFRSSRTHGFGPLKFPSSKPLFTTPPWIRGAMDANVGTSTVTPRAFTTSGRASRSIRQEILSKLPGGSVHGSAGSSLSDTLQDAKRSSACTTLRRSAFQLNTVLTPGTRNGSNDRSSGRRSPGTISALFSFLESPSAWSWTKSTYLNRLGQTRTF